MSLDNPIFVVHEVALPETIGTESKQNVGGGRRRSGKMMENQTSVEYFRRFLVVVEFF